MANRSLAHDTEERGLRALAICAAGMLVRCCSDCQREDTRRREQKQKHLTQQCTEKGGEIEEKPSMRTQRRLQNPFVTGCDCQR